MKWLQTYRIVVSSFLVLFLSAAIGCLETQETVRTEYGKIRGKSAGTSVNGVSVLADMFRERGHSVSRYGRLSPKIERYETLVWFPENQNCPSDEAIERLEEWIQNGYQRTLIYVGYDFAGEIEYYRMLVNKTQGEQKERAMRALAEAQMTEDSRRYTDYSFDWQVNFIGGQPTDDRCRWFDLAIEPRKKSDRLDGPFAQSLGSESIPEFQTRAWLQPRDSYPESYPGRKLEILLSVDQSPFIFRYKDEPADENQYWATENQLIFVTNASFLANYGLVDSANRRLAEQMIDQVAPYSDVLFLESDERGIVVSDSDYESHNSWSWITQKPLCYMVPHFLAWGVLFCFTCYPIFGRPRKIESGRNRSFGDHVSAVARLSVRHVGVEMARAKVKNFLEADDNERNKFQANRNSSKENKSK